MEPPEVPTEHLTEEIREHAHESKEKWQTFVALTTAIVAVLAAFASSMAGKYDTEAMMHLIDRSDKWAQYQAKSVKSYILSGNIKLLEADNKPVDPKDIEKNESLKREMAQIAVEAKDLQSDSDAELNRHELFGTAVAMFQVAIAIAAISVVMKRRSLFGVSLLFVIAGVFYLIWQAVPMKPKAEEPSSGAPAAEGPAQHSS